MPRTVGWLIALLIMVCSCIGEEVSVTGMTSLYNTVSDEGGNIMANGDTAVMAVGSYECSEASGACASSDNMLEVRGLSGKIVCSEDEASCVLHGDSASRGMWVEGSGTGTLILRAVAVVDGEAGWGGGIYLRSNAIVDVELCVFSNCRATYSSSGSGGEGGAIYVVSFGTTVNIYGTRFNGNTAASGKGDDIFRAAGTVYIRYTCPSPYSLNTPTPGKMRMGNV